MCDIFKMSLLNVFEKSYIYPEAYIKIFTADDLIRPYPVELWYCPSFWMEKRGWKLPSYSEKVTETKHGLRLLKQSILNDGLPPWLY